MRVGSFRRSCGHDWKRVKLHRCSGSGSMKLRVKKYWVNCSHWDKTIQKSKKWSTNLTYCCWGWSSSVLIRKLSLITSRSQPNSGRWEGQEYWQQKTTWGITVKSSNQARSKTRTRSKKTSLAIECTVSGVSSLWSTDSTYSLTRLLCTVRVLTT
jgi:hypothetical protein